MVDRDSILSDEGKELLIDEIVEVLGEEDPMMLREITDELYKEERAMILVGDTARSIPGKEIINVVLHSHRLEFESDGLIGRTDVDYQSENERGV